MSRNAKITAQLIRDKLTNAKKQHIMKLQDEFTFGQYRGNRLRTVIDIDYKYVAWCVASGAIAISPRAQSMIDEIERFDLSRAYNRDEFDEHWEEIF